MDANILDKKIELIQWLSSLEDKTIIDKLIQFRKETSNNWWESISSDEKASIEKGIKDSDGGNLTSHSNAKKLYEKWL